MAKYSVYDIAGAHMFPLSVSNELGDHPFLLHAEWAAPAHSVIAVHAYDVYYRPNPRAGPAYRVTNTAVPGVIFNGVPDWLYEEEVLEDNKAFWMSKDGHMLLYASFNDTLVEEFKFPWYGVAQESQQLYPEIRSLRYPKPGTRNPHVTLYVADLVDPKNIRRRDLKPPMALGPTTDYYFTAVTWVSSTEVAVVWMNRAQNVSMITICKSPMWYCQETQRVTGESSGWVESPGAPLFSPDGNTYLSLAPILDGPSGYYRHIVSVNIPKKKYLAVTHGTFDVFTILSWDHRRNLTYYLAVPEGHAGQLHLYSIPTNVSSGVALTATCLSCPPGMENPKSPGSTKPPPPPLVVHRVQHASGAWDDDDETTSPAPPPPQMVPPSKKKEPWIPQEMPLYRPCLYHNAIFSPDSSHFILECLGPGVPTVHLYRAPNASLKATQLITLQNNTRLYEKIAKVALPQVKTFPVEISGGYQALVRLLLPPGLREDEITRYPLVLQVYGGPGSQLVTEKWKIEWSTYLATNQNMIVGLIDGRGTSGRGYNLMHQVYKRLGTVEVNDQLEVTEYLRDNLHFIDPRRVGVWGWSYGGFVSAMLLSAPGQDIFQCGISVAPITSWRLYDSAYTERYMGMPNITGNYKGYEEAELSRRVEGLRDKSLYLVHGTADDNVHLQHGLHFARALSNAGIVYTQQIYPDENHSLSGVKKHLYRSMAAFFNDCFQKQLPPEGKSGLKNGGGGGSEW